MINTKISISIPYDEFCDPCQYIRYESEGTAAICSIFSKQLDTNSDDQYTPTEECIKLRG
jgi:hypothetical protein